MCQKEANQDQQRFHPKLTIWIRLFIVYCKASEIFFDFLWEFPLMGQDFMESIMVVIGSLDVF